MEELIRFQQEIIKILSNPLLIDPNYIPTIEEEQALANRRLLFQGDPANFSPELRVLLNQINRMRFGLNGAEISSGFGRIIQNWKGNKKKYENSSETPQIQSFIPQKRVKSVEKYQLTNVPIFDNKNDVARENIKSLFKIDKKSGKKRKNKKFIINDNHFQRSEWIFEDDYNRNHCNDQSFKSGDTSLTIFPLNNNS